MGAFPIADGKRERLRLYEKATSRREVDCHAISVVCSVTVILNKESVKLL